MKRILYWFIAVVLVLRAVRHARAVKRNNRRINRYFETIGMMNPSKARALIKLQLDQGGMASMIPDPRPFWSIVADYVGERILAAKQKAA